MKALNAAVKVRVPVRIEAVRPRKAQAPTGSGLKTRPATVERKMARSCQAWGESSGGLGIRKQRIRPTERERMRGRILAPCGGRWDWVVGGAGGGGEEEEEAAWMGFILWWGVGERRERRGEEEEREREGERRRE